MRQTVKFPLLAIVSVNDERKDKFVQLLQELNEASSDDEKQKVLKKAQEITLPEEEMRLLDAFGTKSYLDFIDVSLDLKNFLFEVYASEQKEPEAPFARFSFQAKMQGLSERLDKEDISSSDLDDDFCQVIKNVLSDDERWKSLQVFTQIAQKGDSLHFPMNYRGLMHFDQIINKSVEILNAKFDQTSKTAPQV